MLDMSSDQPLDPEEILHLVNKGEAEIDLLYEPFRTTNRTFSSLGVALAAVSGLVLGLGIGLALSLLLQTHSNCHASTPSVCHQEETSPILDDITIKYHSQTFNGSFVHTTIYRQDASPAVDAAWEALGVNCKMTATDALESVSEY